MYFVESLGVVCTCGDPGVPFSSTHGKTNLMYPNLLHLPYILLPAPPPLHPPTLYTVTLRRPLQCDHLYHTNTGQRQLEEPDALHHCHQRRRLLARPAYRRARAGVLQQSACGGTKHTAAFVQQALGAGRVRAVLRQGVRRGREGKKCRIVPRTSIGIRKRVSNLCSPATKACV